MQDLRQWRLSRGWLYLCLEFEKVQGLAQMEGEVSYVGQQRKPEAARSRSRTRKQRALSL